MNIAKKINIAIVEHEVETGKKPTRLYLGRDDWEQLKEYASNVFQFRMRDVTGVQRSEYCGLRIYKVDDESYVAVGA